MWYRGTTGQLACGDGPSWRVERRVCAMARCAWEEAVVEKRAKRPDGDTVWLVRCRSMTGGVMASCTDRARPCAVECG